MTWMTSSTTSWTRKLAGRTPPLSLPGARSFCVVFTSRPSGGVHGYGQHVQYNLCRIRLHHSRLQQERSDSLGMVWDGDVLEELHHSFFEPSNVLDRY